MDEKRIFKVRIKPNTFVNFFYIPLGTTFFFFREEFCNVVLRQV